MDGDGYVDVTANPFVLWRVGEEAARFAEEVGGVTKIVTVETGGVPIATMSAYQLGVPLVVARKRRIGNGWVGHEWIVNFEVRGFYVKAGSIRRNERVLIVDDVARSGVTVYQLSKLVRKFKAIVAGAFILVGVGECEEKLRRLVGNLFPVKVLLRVHPSSGVKRRRRAAPVD